MPAQGVWLLVQGQITEDPGGVRGGTSGPLHPPIVLGHTTDGSSRKGLIRGGAFKGLWGVAQGDPLSPTIFNVVVDAVVQH